MDEEPAAAIVSASPAAGASADASAAPASGGAWLFYPHYLHLHFKRFLPHEMPIGFSDERAWWYPVELCFSNEIDMYRSSDLHYSQFPVGLQARG